MMKIRRRRSWIEELLCDVQDRVRYDFERGIEWSPDDEDLWHIPFDWQECPEALQVDLYGRRLG